MTSARCSQRTALKLPCGHLIYAKGAGDAVRHEVREAGVEILRHALDLDTEPAVLIDQVRDLVSFLAEDRTGDKVLAGN